MIDEKLTSKIIGAAMKVHTTLGPGLLESAYKECLYYELGKLGLLVEKEKPMPIVYDEIKLNHGYRLDILVEGKVVVEAKAVDALAPVHQEQILTYLRLGRYEVGLLINFHTAHLKDGLKRVVLTRKAGK